MPSPAPNRNDVLSFLPLALCAPWGQPRNPTLVFGGFVSFSMGAKALRSTNRSDLLLLDLKPLLSFVLLSVSFSFLVCFSHPSLSLRPGARSAEGENGYSYLDQIEPKGGKKIPPPKVNKTPKQTPR